MIPELANLISFIMRLMPNLVPENALHILDLISYNVDHLPKDLIQSILQGSIEPLIDITQLQPPLHPQEKKRRPNFECNMTYPSGIRGKGPLLKCTTYAEKQMRGFKDPPMYIYLLFTAYLRCSWNLSAKVPCITCREIHTVPRYCNIRCLCPRKRIEMNQKERN